MKRILLFLFLVTTLKSYAQLDSLTSFGVGVGQDSFFGFYLCGNGSYTLSKKTNLTFYTNYWANPAFGNASSGTDFWTEVGVGLNFGFFDKKLNVNPSLGFTYGKLLSGGEKGVLGDGIMPSIMATYGNSKIDLTVGGEWFKALRKEGPVTVDYLWFWGAVGYKFNPRITAGLHMEDFYLSRMTENKPANLYTWVGPYIQFNTSKGIYVKATGGYDSVNKNYFKIFTYIPLTNL